MPRYSLVFQALCGGMEFARILHKQAYQIQILEISSLSGDFFQIQKSFDGSYLIVFVFSFVNTRFSIQNQTNAGIFLYKIIKIEKRMIIV